MKIEKGELNKVSDSDIVDGKFSFPKRVTSIGEDAFCNCSSLTEITIPEGIENIEKSAFKGCSGFKYLYKLKAGESVLAKELPKDKESISEILELEKTTKAFVGFEYTILFKEKDLSEILKLSEKLNKSNFNIPYVYAKMIFKKGMVESFCNNCDFRFFKNEFPNINEELLHFPQEEQLDFF